MYGMYHVFLSLSFVLGYESARILVVVPTPSISHQVVFHPLTKELARRGHEVVTITADSAFPKGQSIPNVTEIDIHDISYGVLRDVIPAFRLEDDLYDQMKVYYKIFYRTVEEIAKSAEVQELLKYEEDHFDLLMIESVTRSALIFSHFFKAPVISISSFGMMLETTFASGAPGHPLLYPTIFHQKIYNLNVWDKVVQLWKHVKHDYLFSYYESVQDEMLKGLFGPDVPTIRELTSNIELFFLNTHPVWADNQPVPPNVIYLSGIHQKPYKELPQDLKYYMDESKNGVIYMSLGTNVKTSGLGEQKTNMLMEVFSQLSYDVLLKWDEEKIQKCPQNVKVVKWVPQSDLLRHPALKLFITQAGLQSTDEAINAGVPLIALPILGDQFYNAEKYEKHNIGLKFNIETLTADELKEGIRTVIGDKRYRENIHKLRSIIHDQSQPPLERAIWWTEYVLRHGGVRHLRAPAANMSWSEYYELKLILIIFTCSMTLVIIISTTLYYCIKLTLQSFVRRKIKIS